jgi:hypothetical protein
VLTVVPSETQQIRRGFTRPNDTKCETTLTARFEISIGTAWHGNLSKSALKCQVSNGGPIPRSLTGVPQRNATSAS